MPALSSVASRRGSRARQPRQVGEVLKQASEALLDGFEALELDQLVRHLVIDLDDLFSV